jgi:formate hydrogenlyase subunit 6/NADH:ubiquinone oxidoreductase subunit I
MTGRPKVSFRGRYPRVGLSQMSLDVLLLRIRPECISPRSCASPCSPNSVKLVIAATTFLLRQNKFPKINQAKCQLLVVTPLRKQA